MELLQRAEEMDFLDLYCGQVAWEDLGKIRNHARRQVVRLPKFLSQKKLEAYKDMVLQMAAANLAPAAGMPGRPLLAGYRRFYPKGQDKKPAFVAKVDVSKEAKEEEEKGAVRVVNTARMLL